MSNDDIIFENQQLVTESQPRSLAEPLFINQQLAPQQATDASKAPAEVAVNPIVAAASSLLGLNTQLAGQTTPPELNRLHDTLSEAVKRFENKIHALGYRAPVILAARYFICALIDETILKTPWGEDSLWREHNLLQTFQREPSGSERFFLILERSCEDPKLHIDLLELGYLCLSLGFEGQYRDKPNGHTELKQVIENVYHLIRYVRGDFSRRLLVSSTNQKTEEDREKSEKPGFRFPPTWVAASACVVALLGIYIPYHIHLSRLAAPISKMIQEVPLSNNTSVTTTQH